MNNAAISQALTDTLNGLRSDVEMAGEIGWVGGLTSYFVDSAVFKLECLETGEDVSKKAVRAMYLRSEWQLEAKAVCKAAKSHPLNIWMKNP